MPKTAPAKKCLRAMCFSLWLSQTIWLAASVACAQGPGLCGDEDDELLTPSAWCTIERSRYLPARRHELITPDAWTEEHISCRTLLEPFEGCVPGSELVTPEDWRVHEP